jgi:DNA-binding SARP family transcriptional activator
MPFYHFAFAGTVCFGRGGHPTRSGLTGSTLSLFALLALNAGMFHRKEQVTEMLWPQSDEARRRSALNSALFRIRRALQDMPATVEADAGAVRIVLDPAARVDALALRDAVAAARQAPCAEAAAALGEVLGATAAPFLDGLEDRWAQVERERLTELRIRGLGLLMRWYAARDLLEDALDVGRMLVDADPLHEVNQCQLINLYVRNGERARALRQYEALRRTLHDELGIEPMPATRALYDNLRCGLDAPADPSHGLQAQGASFP